MRLNTNIAWIKTPLRARQPNEGSEVVGGMVLKHVQRLNNKVQMIAKEALGFSSADYWNYGGMLPLRRAGLNAYLSPFA